MTPPLPSTSAMAVVARLLAGKATSCKAVARQRQHQRAHRRQHLQLRLRPRAHRRQHPQLRLQRRERRRQRRQLRSRQQLRQLRRRHRRLLTRPDIRRRPGRSRRVVRRCNAKWTSYRRELARDPSRVPRLRRKRYSRVSRVRGRSITPTPMPMVGRQPLVNLQGRVLHQVN